MPGWGIPDGVVDRARARPREQRLRRRDRRPDIRHRRPEHVCLPTLPNPARRLDQISAALDFVTGPRISTFAGPVDPNKVAVGGHSIAGAIAFQTSLADRARARSVRPRRMAPRTRTRNARHGSRAHDRRVGTRRRRRGRSSGARRPQLPSNSPGQRTSTSRTSRAWCPPSERRRRCSDSAPSAAPGQPQPTQWSSGSSTQSSETASRRRLRPA